MCTVGFKSKTSGENAAILNFSHLLSFFLHRLYYQYRKLELKINMYFECKECNL